MMPAATGGCGKGSPASRKDGKGTSFPMVDGVFSVVMSPTAAAAKVSSYEAINFQERLKTNNNGMIDMP